METGSLWNPAPPPDPASDVELLKKMTAFLEKEAKMVGDMLGLLGQQPQSWVPPHLLMYEQRLGGKQWKSPILSQPSVVSPRLFSGAGSQNTW